MGTAELRNIAKQIRYYTTDEIATLGVGHIGGSLSIADVLAVLYFKEMNVDPKIRIWKTVTDLLYPRDTQVLQFMLLWH